MTKLVELYAREVLAGNRKLTEVPAAQRDRTHEYLVDMGFYEQALEAEYTTREEDAN